MYTGSRLHLFKPHLFSPLLPCFFHLDSHTLGSQMVLSGFLLGGTKSWKVRGEGKTRELHLCVVSEAAVVTDGEKRKPLNQ